MNWTSGLIRLFAVFSAASIAISAFAGVQNKSGVYEFRTAAGEWEKGNYSCMPGTFEAGLIVPSSDGGAYDDPIPQHDPYADIAQPVEQFDYRAIGECREWEDLFLDALTGVIPPIILMLLLSLGFWIFRGFKPAKTSATKDEG